VYDPETLAIGVLGRPHGVGGELVLRPFNTVGRVRPLSPADAGIVLLVRDGRATSNRLHSCRAAGDHLLVAFVGVDSLEAARVLTHSEVRVSRRALPALEPGEFYVEDVIGCDVVGTDGRALGRVTGTFWNGAHDVMTVVGDADGEALIPIIPDVVVAVEPEARRVRVNWQLDEDRDE
jgi:16S rRNA processing protein RimM